MTLGAAQRHWSGTAPAGRLRGTSKSLPEQARAHNRHLVLRTLYHAGTLSRAEIARATGLAPGTTSTLIRELTDEGLIVECEKTRNQRPGKPSTPLTLNPEAYQVIGIDLTDPVDASGAVMDLRGRMVARETVDSREPVTVDVIADLGRRLVKRATRPVLGVGVSCPGIITPAGEVLWSTTYGWADLALGSLLSTQIGYPVMVANDANAATLAEFTFGGAPGDGHMTITVGRGVGAGLMLGGILVQGDGFSVGEIGHVTAVDEGAECECGRRGCLQTVVSAPILRLLASEAESPESRRRYAAIGDKFGAVLAPLVGALTLREIRVSAHGNLLRPELLAAMERTIHARVLPSQSPPVLVRRSKLGGDAQVLGAAALVLSAELGIA